MTRFAYGHSYGEVGVGVDSADAGGLGVGDGVDSIPGGGLGMGVGVVSGDGEGVDVCIIGNGLGSFFNVQLTVVPICL